MDSRTTVVLGATLGLACLATSASFAQEKRALCKPVETMSLATRVHVKCELPVDGTFAFFAASLQDARFASRMLNVSLVGQVSEKTLAILFDPNDQSGVAFGCQAQDCRVVRAIALTESAAPVATPVAPVPGPGPGPTPRAECLAACNDAAGLCMSQAQSVPDRQACIAEKRACDRDCN